RKTVTQRSRLILAVSRKSPSLFAIAQTTRRMRVLASCLSRTRLGSWSSATSSYLCCNSSTAKTRLSLAGFIFRAGRAPSPIHSTWTASHRGGVRERARQHAARPYRRIREEGECWRRRRRRDDSTVWPAGLAGRAARLEERRRVSE